MKAHIAALTSAILLQSSASALTISLDFTSTSFFDTNTADGALARAAVEKAAADISAAITTQLSAVNGLSYSGSVPGATVGFAGALYYTNPDTGVQQSLSTINLAQDEFKIFVGARSLGGGTLGQGGPGSAGYQASLSYNNVNAIPSATAAAETNFNNAMQRGSSITVSSLDGSISGTPFTLNYAPTIGNLWFDNDGSTSWHRDAYNGVVGGRIDLYSVALHEILHTLGIGIYDSWDANISGNTNWTGQEVIDLYGTGNNLIDSNGSHIASNITSKRLSDGSTQTVVMSPSISAGVRKELTELDLAFLRDLGWTTVPEPTSMTLLGLGSLAFILRRKRAVTSLN